MLAQDRSRVVVAGVIVAAHVAAIAGLATLGQRAPAVMPSAPIEVRFVAASAPQERWQPPEVQAVVPNIVAPTPELPLIEIPAVAAPSEKAISVPVKVAAAAPATDAGKPPLIASVEYLREPEPRYPPQSRKLREQGLVVLRVLIDEKGAACSIEVETSSGFARLDRAAREAVSRALFRPYLEGGLPRRAFVLIPIEFSYGRSV